MYTAFDFKVNKPSAMGLNSLGTVVTPSGVTTEILYIEQPEGVRFYLRDVLNYPEYLECLDLPKIIEWFSRGLTWEKLEGESRLILRALPKPRRGIDLDLLANEAVKITRRFMLEYSVITPLLAWDELQDLTIDAPDADGLPRIFIRVRGFGDAYHPVIITPNKCQLAEPRTRLAKIISLLTGEASASTSEEALTFNAFIINKASERTRTSVTMYNPRGMATDAGLRLRVTMHAEPVSINTTAFRKHPEKPWHLAD
ncbi:hypothetical protein [Vulcanisaeta sp. JCM 16159]|uniref:hypothetical protein n=1 Tax=Vulcanisaeta sp. JCM 16159 TaxID=1295371 RepID=UPI001FB4D630|nr:hypothetical protein [Vulcanisaeta sp. JCM 16159]